MITRADQILAKFVEYHATNPKIWELFKRFTFEAINSGHEHYSSDCVCHRIRWHTDVEARGETVKIGNNYTAYYARMFHVVFPQHDGFFRNRKLTSQDRSAYKNEDLELNFQDPENEEFLLKVLADIGQEDPF